jgi:hypothetical protein
MMLCMHACTKVQHVPAKMGSGPWGCCCPPPKKFMMVALNLGFDNDVLLLCTYARNETPGVGFDEIPCWRYVCEYFGPRESLVRTKKLIVGFCAMMPALLFFSVGLYQKARLPKSSSRMNRW